MEQNIIMCEYGCGNIANYIITKKQKYCCEMNAMKCPRIKEKNSLGLKLAYNTGKRKILLPNNRDWAKNKNFWNDSRIKSKHTLEEIFSYSNCSNNNIRKSILIDERGYLCEECGINSWNNKPITLELDHIDGNTINNNKSNLKLLCPNCHSQTSTWKVGQKNKKQSDYIPDEIFIKALKSTKNIRQALLEIGLTAKGANYVRAKKLLAIM